MKKILFVIESLHCGGAEKSLVTLLQNFDFTQNQVELLLFKEGGAFEKFVPEQVKVRYISSLESINSIRLLFLKFKFKALLFNNKSNKYHSAQLFWKSFGSSIRLMSSEYDIAIAYNQGFSTYFVAEKINSKNKYAWLNTDYKKAGYNAEFDYPMYSVFNKVVAVSDENLIPIKEEMKIIGKSLPMIVINDITDVDVVRKLALQGEGLPINENFITILSVGRLAKAKAFNLAIAACRSLKDKNYNVKWYIIGEGGERAFLEQLIKENELQDELILLGFKENPYPYIKSCDIYVQTSIFEGLGLTVVEASLLHKPIVCTNFPTAYKILSDEKTGLIVQMNSEDISNAVQKLIDQPELRLKFQETLSKQVNPNKQDSLDLIYKLINN